MNILDCVCEEGDFDASFFLTNYYLNAGNMEKASVYMNEALHVESEYLIFLIWEVHCQGDAVVFRQIGDDPVHETQVLPFLRCLLHKSCKREVPRRSEGILLRCRLSESGNDKKRPPSHF